MKGWPTQPLIDGCLENSAPGYTGSLTNLISFPCR